MSGDTSNRNKVRPNTEDFSDLVLMTADLLKMFRDENAPEKPSFYTLIENDITKKLKAAGDIGIPPIEEYAHNAIGAYIVTLNSEQYKYMSLSAMTKAIMAQPLEKAITRVTIGDTPSGEVRATNLQTLLDEQIKIQSLRILKKLTQLQKSDPEHRTQYQYLVENAPRIVNKMIGEETSRTLVNEAIRQEAHQQLEPKKDVETNSNPRNITSFEAVSAKMVSISQTPEFKQPATWMERMQAEHSYPAPPPSETAIQKWHNRISNLIHPPKGRTP